MWWHRLAWFIWAWDEAIQDLLSAGPFGTASAYQLGRGLAEAYWSLDADDFDPGSGHSWTFLLGDNRIAALTSVCRRLQPTMGKFTMLAIAGSLRAWHQVVQSAVAVDPPSLVAYESPDDALSEQTLIWRDLLLTGEDPVNFVPSDRIQHAVRQVGPLLRAFRWELIGGAVAAVVLGLSVYFLGSAAIASIGTVLGAFGLTVSAVLARAKGVVQSVGDRVKEAIYQDTVIEGVTRVPNRRAPDAPVTARPIARAHATPPRSGTVQMPTTSAPPFTDST
jgi:hypothetical protein